ncbi:hypothetical protein GCM10022251_77900 [Phytohabitans flavus]|uniref:Peptidase C14 caspase domain-containing protein n=1 Tax=Phytohabitans flavus TaxID=1076124 RepID=A0A6F8XNQ5_9ACTN|nr:caspase family protein [Phytohabitans flavus]BCB75398.1 hypothetical protein Pflav_018080 [Phytohabitans flavus]
MAGLIGSRQALIIATAGYRDPGLSRLRGPVHDAAGLIEVLGAPHIGGFEVTELTEQSAHQLRVGIEDFLTERVRDDDVVVYLSCHGIRDARGRLYFAATDTRKDRLGSTAVESQWLLDQLDQCRARRQLLVLDCCFSGAFASGAKGPDAKGDDEDLRQHLNSHGRGRTVLTASRSSEYSFEGKPLPGAFRTGSVFTTGLVEGLRTGAADADEDGYISVDDAYDYAYTYVQSQDAGQTPQRWLTGGEGKMWLARNPSAPTRRPPVPAPAPAPQPATAPPRPGAGGTDGWRAKVGDRQTLSVTGTKVYGVEWFNPTAAIVSYLVWLFAAGGLAYTTSPVGWLGAGFTVGTFVLSAVWFSGIRRKTIVVTATLGLLGTGVGVLYLLVAILDPARWPVRVWVVGTLLAYLLCLAAQGSWLADVRRVRAARREQPRREEIAAMVRANRWLNGRGADSPHARLLEHLAVIPAARFARLEDGRFLVLVGRRAVVVKFVRWPAGTYTRYPGAGADIRLDGAPYLDAIEHAGEVIREAEQWDRALLLVKVRPVLVVYPSGGKVSLPAADGAGLVDLVTPEAFADTAGNFLVEYAYQARDISVETVERVLTRLETVPVSADRADVEPMPAAPVAGLSLPAPKAAPTEPREAPAGPFASPAEIVAQRPLPDGDELDSVAADSLRYAAKLVRPPGALDTRLLLVAVARVHVRGRWERIWLYSGQALEHVAARTDLRDPDSESRERWMGVPLTATCAEALRTAAATAQQYGIPVSPGVLVLGLLHDPGSAAARALGVGTTIGHDELTSLVREDILGISA